ncbi:lipase family protein [Mucilaginibacter sp. HC2]|uniref:lipase family protein n=1 Tax=Mucilaginibacter inviolabilis TaxID=2714892 RepID=UPI00140E68F1|nr:lipase family protein [Mucilaginibacter inviolabilis]NHA07384.1 lipase family protein [Mucilaginibacter inviolabilis]
MKPLNLHKLWPALNRTDWNLKAYTLEKTAICCAFSRMAYWQIPKYELEGHDNLKIMPSRDYLEFVKKKQCRTVKELLQQADFGQNFIIETKSLVLIALDVKGTLFIAIRGTASFHEAYTDLKFRTIGIKGDRSIRYHKGFYEAVTECIDQLVIKLHKFDPDIRIYITGHSLGGAMSAILHTLMSGSNAFEHNKYAQALKGYRSHSCYTFGMPRFGNKEAVNISSPFSFYREGDIVPGLPPRFLGYANSRYEYRIDRKTIISKIFIGGSNKLLWVYNWVRRLNVSNHFIEHYYIDLFHIYKKRK